ncbi:hypothetical protein D3C74_464950 [compost metagenome]
MGVALSKIFCLSEVDILEQPASKNKKTSRVRAKVFILTGVNSPFMEINSKDTLL